MAQKKDSSERKVTLMISLPPRVRNALFQKAKAGNRSKFIAKLLAEKLGIGAVEKTIPQKEKGVFHKLFRK